MLNKYLSKLSDKSKKIIVNKMNTESNFKDFVLNCAKLDIFIFDKEYDKLDLNLLTDKFRNLKKYYIKNFGLKICDKYCEDLDKSLNLIDTHYNKIKLKINIIDSILKYLNNELNIINTVKINYSDRYEYINFDESLFVISDDINDIDSIEKNINIDINNDSPYIAEYSN